MMPAGPLLAAGVELTPVPHFCQIRDGAGLLGRGLKILDKTATTARSKIQRFDRKVSSCAPFFPAFVSLICFLLRPLRSFSMRSSCTLHVLFLPPQRLLLLRPLMGSLDALLCILW